MSAANGRNLDALVGLPGPFSVIYADPPWSYYGDPSKDQACGKHYACMTDAELAALPVRDICAARAVVFLWATCPRLDAGIRLLQAWGLHFRGVPFVWVKTRQDGGIIGGQGIRPTLTKPTVELVLAGCTTAKGRTLPILDEGMPQVVLAPRGRHSAKPAEVRDRIVRLMGNVPRVELFARERVQGWEAWGNEVEANVGFRAGAPGTEQAVTADEKVTAAQFMSAVEGVQRVPLVLEKIERATGAGSSLIIPGNAGGIAVPR